MGCGSSFDQNDDYKTFDDMIKDFRNCGAYEDTDLMVGIDATKSNETSGAKSFGGLPLHFLGQKDNPYATILRIATRFFKLDNNGNFPMHYFGSVEAINTGGITPAQYCRSGKSLYNMYKDTIGSQTLSGPTTFVPLIREAMNAVRTSKRFHVLMIITDGAVSDVQEHYDILVEASNYPLGIVCIGVGDGPWDQMDKFDNEKPKNCKFDNFQFVSYNQIIKKEVDDKMEAEFFFRAFMEVPKQYKAVKKILGYKAPTGMAPKPQQQQVVYQPQQPFVTYPQQHIVFHGVGPTGATGP